MQRGHTIKNKSVDVKKALSKNDMQQGGGPMGGGGGPMMGGRGGHRGGRGGRSKLNAFLFSPIILNYASVMTIKPYYSSNNCNFLV